MKTAPEYLRPFIGPEPANFIRYADALAAVQAVIDHYDPLPGVAELVYRVVAPPPQNVFPPACPRCLQRGAECLCPPMFPREEPPF
ncbi:MAG: hypothetical protein ACRYFK_14445 [Janthinobacterium lividum]